MVIFSFMICLAFWLIGYPKAMSPFNMQNRKLSVDKKVEFTPHFSGVDPPQSAEVRQRWGHSWSQSGSPQPPH